MKGIIREELTRTFCNVRFLIVIVVSVALFVIGVYRAPLSLTGFSVHPANRLTMYLEFSEFGFLAVLLATLPFADSFLDDLNQGFLRQILQRVPYRKYQFAKVLAVGLAGGVSLVIVVSLVFVLGLLGDSDWQARYFESSYAFATGQVPGALPGLYDRAPMLYFCYLLASAFGFGVSFALLGLALSPLIHNRYVVLGAPLVLVQVIDFLETRTWHITPAFNPLNALLTFKSNGSSPLVQLVLFGCVSVFSILVFLVLSRKSRLTL
jgi:hypothetical protein